MSRTNPAICCSRCGRYLYVPLTSEELRQVRYAKRIPDFYIINDNGKEEELCRACYKAWETETFDDLGLLANADKESRICSKCHIIATSDFCKHCMGK